jgi:hypothetical protein
MLNHDAAVLGQSQFLTTPVAAKPLSFSLALDDHIHDSETDLRARDLEDSDARLMEMLAAQAAHREVDSLGADEESIAADEKLTTAEKRDILQKSLNMAASNGDVERVRKLVDGPAKSYVDVNMPDEEGTVPLIYASCFVGHPACAPWIKDMFFFPSRRMLIGIDANE